MDSINDNSTHPLRRIRGAKTNQDIIAQVSLDINFYSFNYFETLATGI